MAKEGELRIFVNVPQSYSVAIHEGENAVIRVNEFQGKQFPGKIVRTSDSLDPSSRTLLTEIHIPNPNHTLRPGMFASVKFSLDRTAKTILAPASIMIFNTAGPQVVLVKPDQSLHFQKVTPGRDFGSSIELIAGVNPGDRAVINPSDELAEGMKVEVK
jgi:RND family efflux transporter MFP subunit